MAPSGRTRPLLVVTYFLTIAALAAADSSPPPRVFPRRTSAEAAVSGLSSAVRGLADRLSACRLHFMLTRLLFFQVIEWGHSAIISALDGEVAALPRPDAQLTFFFSCRPCSRGRFFPRRRGRLVRAADVHGG